MAGGAEVCANMAAWLARKTLETTEAMDAHIKASEAYAKGNHPWTNRTGAAEFMISSQTEFNGSEIVSTLGGFHIHNYYLENPNTPFYGKYMILEKARDENIGVLLSKMQALWSRL